MKILIIANNDVGLYQFRRELITTLLRQNEVIIALPDGEWIRPLEESGCQFVHTSMDRRGTHFRKDFGLFCSLWKLIRARNPDLVLTYTIKPNIYGGMVCRLLGTPYAVNITGLGTAFQKAGVLQTLVTRLYKIALKKAKVVFFENSENMQVLQDKGIASKGQSCLLNGAGVNINHYTYSPYPDDEAPTRFLFVGRVMREKGMDELFEAMHRLRARGFRCTLDVLGGCEENYGDKIAACTAQGWLTYHGYQKDVRPFIRKTHCFVLPSYHEGMANTNLECAAMGRPVITSNIPGCREAVVEHVSGLLCEPKNADSLCSAMEHFLSMSPEARAAMGLAGRKHMEEVFDKEKVVAKTIKTLGL